VLPTPERAEGEGRAALTVADAMRPATTSVELDAHLAGAAYLMKRSHDTALVVTDGSTGSPLGIVTDADIAEAVAQGSDVEQTRIRGILGRRTLITASPKDSVDKALHVMLEARVLHLPVVDEGRVVGMVDMSDLCRVMVSSGPVGSAR
jgi:CBS domain-containing protein